MRKKILLSFCTILIFALSLVVSMSAVSLSYNWIPITGYPNGIYSNSDDWKLPGGENDKYYTPLTFGLQITSSVDGLVTVPVSYTTSYDIVGSDLVYTYNLSGDLSSHTSLYARVFLGLDPRWVDISSIDMTLNADDLNIRLGSEQDLAAMMPSAAEPADYYDVVLSTPSGQQIHSARLNPPLYSGDYCFLQSSVFHPNAAMVSYKLKVTFHGVAADFSMDADDIGGVDDLFTSLNDASLAPASSVLSRFWDIPFIRFGMVGVGILMVYAFVTRLF